MNSIGREHDNEIKRHFENNSEKLACDISEAFGCEHISEVIQVTSQQILLQ